MGERTEPWQTPRWRMKGLVRFLLTLNQAVGALERVYNSPTFSVDKKNTESNAFSRS